MMRGVDPMGRGRQRAKQRKVARNLKYFSPETDYAALERELKAQGKDAAHPHSDSDRDTGEYADEYEAYAEYAAKYGVDDYDDCEGEEDGRCAE